MKKVIISILGGVAYVTSRPSDVCVEIIDHDNGAKETIDPSENGAIEVIPPKIS